MRTRWLLFLSLIAMMTLFPACSSDDGGTGPGDTTPTTGTVSGIVGPAGRPPLSGVTVSVDGQSTMTNQDGWFAIVDVPEGDQVVTFELEGYLSTFRNVTVLASQTTHLADVSLLNAESVMVSGANGGHRRRHRQRHLPGRGLRHRIG